MMSYVARLTRFWMVRNINEFGINGQAVMSVVRMDTIEEGKMKKREWKPNNRGFSIPCEYLIACLKQRSCEIGKFSPNREVKDESQRYSDE